MTELKSLLVAAILIFPVLSIDALAGNTEAEVLIPEMCLRGPITEIPKVISAEVAGSDFTLTSSRGEMVKFDSLLTTPALIYFGYTFDSGNSVSKVDLQRNSDAAGILESKGISLNPIFVSIDALRDTPGKIEEFVSSIDTKTIGLTGTAKQVFQASDAFRAYYKVQPGNIETFEIVHSTFTYLNLPDYGLVGFFKRDASPDQLSNVIQCFLED